MRYGIGALGATGLACFLAAPAFGQDTAGGTPNTATAETSQPEIELVIVTARRRPENLEKTPVAVTVLSGDLLRTQEVKSAIDLQNLAPSLTVTASLGSRDTDVFSIRGQNQPFGGADPGVQTYFAEVPFNPSGPGSYYDMANIQVLNGPQGTLFGRSTTGGAVLFEPNRPSDEFGGYLETQLGDYGLREFDGALNVPVVGDRLMVRGAFDIENRDGFTKDTVITGASAPYTEEQDNVDFRAFRVGVTFRPFSHFENYAVFNYLHSSNNGTGAVLTGINTNTIAGLATEFNGGSPCPSPPSAGICTELAEFQYGMMSALAAQNAAGPRNTTSSIPLFYRRETWGAMDIATYDITGDLHLKNIFGYLSDKAQPAFDYDGSFLPLLDISNPRTWESNSLQVTEEIQILGEAADNTIHWIAGYYHELDHPGGYSEVQEDELGGGLAPFPGSTAVQSLTNGGTSDAVYGSATYNASSWVQGLSFTAGGRFTWDHKVATARSCTQNVFNPSPCPYPLPGPETVYAANFEAPTWNLDVDYQVTDDTMLYGAYRRGYKSGGFNSGAGAATDFEEFKPEYLTDVELGTKNNWTILGVPGRTNFDVYYGWYQDVQKNDLVPVVQEFSGPPFVQIDPVALTFNAARATIKGAEFQSTFIPTDTLDVNVFYSYTDATYSKFVLPQSILVDPFGNQTEQNPTSLAGSAFAYTPRNKFGITPRFRIPVDSALGAPSISGTLYWQSTEWFTDLGAEEIAQYGQPPEQKDYMLVNFRADWDNVLGYPVDASVFVTNAFDRTYKVGADAYLNELGTSASIYGPPRMWGVELRYRFGADAKGQ